MARIGILIAIVTASALAIASCGGAEPLPPPPVAAPPPALGPTVAPPPAAEKPLAAEPGAEPERRSKYEPRFVQPEVEPGEDGWEIYTTETGVFTAQAAGMAPGNDTPEAAVIHFYASLMREDERYEEVLIPERSKRLEKKLAKVKGWRYWDVRLERRKPSGDDSYWIKVYFRLEVAELVQSDPVFEEGTDDVEVTRIDGKWYVSDIPT